MKTSSKLSIAYGILYGLSTVMIFAVSFPTVFIWVCFALQGTAAICLLLAIGASMVERKLDKK